MTLDGRSGRRLTATVTDLEVERQRALLVGVALPNHDLSEAERSLSELALLTDTAGSDPVESELIRRQKPDPATFIGRGQADQLAELSRALDIDVVVFDNDLTPAQQRNLHKLFRCDVVDRIAVILDIFAQHATSREGMIQVELALLKYHLPRLKGKGTELSRLGGGIGTRGPGETKLESDRRRILTRISKLERQLKGLAATRDTQRKSRRRSDLPLVSLVGYTNAGKSTLLNQMTDAGVLTEDRLFSTLGSTVRKADLPNGETILLSDTVGFVRRLPHMLVEAFRSTLEEIADAHLLVHVVDGADHAAETQILAVHEVLGDIGATDIDELIVFNKLDIADPVGIARLAALHPEAVFVSALTGEGIEDLGDAIGRRLAGQLEDVKLMIPYERGDVLAAVHRDGVILSEEHVDEGTRLRARLRPSQASQLAGFIE
ncbi:MAG: GTPase HflX [Acidimicrobiia bacterium]|nr:GTPase HflX [Acidimicrobiia bacterium]